MLDRGKFCSSATITTALAVSDRNQISPEGDGAKLSLHLPIERYACNPDNLYAVPRTELQEIEWIEPDLLDGEVSRLVTGSATTTTTRHNQKRCCRTSTSSGYSSHSPPLSAGSYSCYATGVPGQGSFRAAPLPMKDQFGGGLAVIHEGEAIPRPIWPSAFPGQRELYHTDDANPDYDALYACCGCSCAYTYSYCDWDYAQTVGTRTARDVLLELSRTLNSVIEGETTMTPEEILHNISRTLAQGIGLKGSIYEYIYQNPTLVSSSKKSSSLFSAKSSTSNEKTSSILSGSKGSASRVNPVNSKLYSSTHHVYMHNQSWSTSRCEHGHKILSGSKHKERTETGKHSGKTGSAVFLVQDHRHKEGMTKSNFIPQNGKTVTSSVCKCWSRPSNYIKGKRSIFGDGNDSKETVGLTQSKENRGGLNSGESEYTMPLECSDEGSSNDGIVLSPKKGQWDRRLRDLTEDLDFTLDGFRAERLTRAIAKAKRRRQWCTVLTTLFGLVFFVLSVVVVSLSVTRGRKVFGSM